MTLIELSVIILADRTNYRIMEKINWNKPQRILLGHHNVLANPLMLKPQPHEEILGTTTNKMLILLWRFYQDFATDRIRFTVGLSDTVIHQLETELAQLDIFLLKTLGVARARLHDEFPDIPKHRLSMRKDMVVVDMFPQ